MQLTWKYCYLFTILVVVCVIPDHALSAAISNKNVTDAARDNGQILPRTSQTIIRPTNVFKEMDGLVDDEQEKTKDLRPFEWLHKQLGEYLKCAYGRHSGCESKLAKALNFGQSSWNSDDNKSHEKDGDDKEKRMDRGPMHRFGKPHDRFVVMDVDPEKFDENETTLLKERGNFQNSFPFDKNDRFKPMGPEKSFNPMEFDRRDRMPFFSNRGMPLDGFHDGGRHPGQPGPMEPRKNHGGEPRSHPEMHAFPKFIEQLPFQMMGLPFLIPMH